MMSAQHIFYLERAAAARATAGAATLDNVRERWLRSEASWTEMAARSDRGEKMRARLIAEKAVAKMAAAMMLLRVLMMSSPGLCRLPGDFAWHKRTITVARGRINHED